MDRVTQPSSLAVRGQPPRVSITPRRLRQTSYLAALLALILSAAAVSGALAASPAPTQDPNAPVKIDAHALLGGNVRPGAWTAVEVHVTNDGPAIVGELRIRGPQQGQSRYGVEADLPTGAKQEFTLYAQTALFGSRLFVDLVTGEQVLATQTVTIHSHDAYSPIVAVIAEKPAGLLPDVTAAMTTPNVQPATVITLGVADLPARIEAWAAIDRLIWQDVDASLLSSAQLEALRLWVGAGGRLTLLGGSTGPGTLRAFGTELLPFDPNHTVDVAAADLTSLIGTPPAGLTTVPAIGGLLNHGTILASSGNDVIAADAGYGRGAVTLIGFDPSTPGIARTPAGEAMWHRLLPQSSGPALNPLTLPDDSQIVYALQNLPSVDLPPIEQLFVLLLAYIALIGPVNYLILRRLDKREWAWVTIPALVVVFAVGSYGLGATLKGSDVIVNQITVVRAAQGTGRGIGQAYVGIYSPSRRSFDVRIPGGALLSNPTSMAQTGQTETPLDVVFGESSSRLRDFEVGFGVLRGFRAEAPADAPQIDSDIRLVSGKLQGTITNRSESQLEDLAVLFGGGVAVVPKLDPGQSSSIDLDVTSNLIVNSGLSEMVFGSTFPRDQDDARRVYTRRAVLDQLFPCCSNAIDSPILLAWRQGPVLDVQLPGDSPNRVGDGLFVIPLSMTLDSQQVFADQLIRRTIVETTAANGTGDINGMNLSRGTMTVETRPQRFDGSFHVTSLEIAMTQGEIRTLGGGRGIDLQPLPADQQPSQTDPLTEGPAPSATPTPSTLPGTSPEPTPTDGGIIVPPDGGGGKPPPIGAPGMDGVPLPAFQLFDRVDQKWVEFPAPRSSLSYVIGNPDRYVDSGGAVLFRFVNRLDAGQFGEDQLSFQLLMRLEGTIG